MSAPYETDEQRQIRELRWVVAGMSRELNIIRGILAFLVVIVFAVFAYAGWHAVQYRGCAIQPSLFSWPSECV